MDSGGTVTAIRIQQKNPRRANLYLDGKFALGLSLEVVQEFGLRRGMTLSESDLQGLRQAEEGQRALQDALRLLSYRARSVAEMQRRLVDKGYAAASVEGTIGRLEELGLLNDLEFARSWVENRQTFRPRGRRALISELRRKGVSTEIIDQVLEEMLEEGEQAELALSLARKRAVRLGSLDRQAFTRRLYSFLARRGFAGSLIREVVQRVWEEHEGAERGR